MTKTYRAFDGLNSRPDPSDRLFRSQAVEDAITTVGDRIADDNLRRLFSQCLPNTLDTTTYLVDGDEPDAYIVTGDIPALWLRDSTNQVWPYLRWAKTDPELGRLFRGLIRRQGRCVTADPYANAFIDNGIVPDAKGPYVSDAEAERGVWERKWELDSLASFLRLSTGYYDATGDTTPFTADWIAAVEAVVGVITTEQATMDRLHLDDLYRFAGPDGESHPAVRLQGYGYPARHTGLVRTVFRPSDDEAVWPYHVPANAALVVALRATAKLARRLRQADLATRLNALARTVDAGLRSWGIIKHPTAGRIYAYEVDGFGSAAVLDDPNAPSLLSLPYLGYCQSTDPVYQATRQVILSEHNPFYVQGPRYSGLASPHTGVLDNIWPIGVIMQALTSTDETEIHGCLQTLLATHGGTFFMHESVNLYDPGRYTRSWFAWANTMLGELILKLADEQPELLSRQF
jgi:meiotically up-regulated gene 157 (Mug157) protein